LFCLSRTRKGGERVHAGKEKSHKEKSCCEKDCKKEDRKKEEISFPQQMFFLFRLGMISPAFFYGLLFLRSLTIMKLHS
jgi:hypothetical protein